MTAQPTESNGGKLPRRPYKRSPLLAAMMFAGLALSLPQVAADNRPKRKCRLPDCPNLTDHNGGYCCAEHHAEGTKK
jgi:hypothetical protein